MDSKTRKIKCHQQALRYLLSDVLPSLKTILDEERYSRTTRSRLKDIEFDVLQIQHELQMVIKQRKWRVKLMGMLWQRKQWRRYREHEHLQH